MMTRKALSKITAASLSVFVLGGTLPAVQLTAPVITAFAEEGSTEVTQNSLTFNVFTDHAELTKCDKSYAGELIIPGEINGVPVTTISYSSVAGCLNITSVTIPDSVTAINMYAFQACKALASVTIPGSVSTIEEFAFDQTPWLEERQAEDPFVVVNGILIDGKTCSGDITIPDTVSVIANNAFDYCQTITSVVIQDNVTTIGSEAFSGCYSLKSVSLPDSITNIPDWAFYGSGLTSVTIPDSVTSIGTRAFNLCYDLETITIPDSVSEIGGEAFDSTAWMSLQQTADPLVIVNGILINGRTYVGELIVPNTVTTIADSAFWENEELTALTIPDSVTYIGGHSFQDCTQLMTVTMADSVTYMGEYAFNWCSELQEVTLSKSLKSIEKDTFTYCNLREMDIPASVESIGETALHGCRLMSKITINNPDCVICDAPSTISTEHDKELKRDVFDGEIWGYSGSTAQAYAEKYDCKFKDIEEDKDPEVITEGKLRFNVYPNHAALAGYNSEPLGDITVPSTVNGVPVTGVEDGGLFCCHVSSVTLPASVSRIDPYSFQGCVGLDSITILNPDCKIADNRDTISNAMDDETGQNHYTGTIRGYEGSTAQAYAEKYGYKFEALTEPSVTYGDVNGDSAVNLNDAVAILQYVALSAKYPIEGDALEAADVFENGTSGINGQDALVIMMVDAGLISSDKLPVTSQDLK